MDCKLLLTGKHVSTQYIATYWQRGDWHSADFRNPSGSRQGLLNAIQSVGSICSLPIAPNLADWIGRQKSILVGSLIVALGLDFSPAQGILACSSLDVSSVRPTPIWLKRCTRIPPSWTGFRYQRHCKPIAHHRTRTPKSTWQNHSSLQHLLLLRLHHRGMDHLWHTSNQKQLVMEASKLASSCSQRIPNMRALASPRKSSMAYFQGSTRWSSPSHGEVSCQWEHSWWGYNVRTCGDQRGAEGGESSL